MKGKVNLFKNVKRYKKSVIFILLWNVLFCLGLSMYTVLYNLYLNEVISLSSIGSVVGVNFLIYGLFSLVGGLLADRIGPRAVLQIGLIILFTGIVGSIFTMSTLPLYGWAVVTGTGQALTNVMFVPLLTQYSASEERGKLFSLAYGTGNLFMFLGTMGAGLLSDFLTSHFSLQSFIGFRWVVLSAAFVIAVSLLPLFAVKQGEAVTPNKPVKSASNEKKDKTYKRYGLVKLLEGLGIGLTIPFLNLFLSGRYDVSAGQISLILSLATLFTVVLIFLNPFITGRVGEVKALIIYQLIGLPALLMAGLVTNIMVCALGLVLFRALLYAMMPIQSKLLMEKTPINARGFTNSFGFMASTIGSGISGFISMRIAASFGSYWGYLTLFSISAACILISVSVFFISFRSRENSSKTFVGHAS